MKHLLINQGYKLQESKTTTSITNIQLIYIITREEMRELKKKTDSNILDSIRFKRTENASNNILNNIKIKPNYEISRQSIISMNDYNSNISSGSLNMSRGSNSDKSSIKQAANYISNSDEYKSTKVDSPSISSSLTYDSTLNKVRKVNKETLSFLQAYSKLSAEKSKKLEDGFGSRMQKFLPSINSSTSFNDSVKSYNNSSFQKISQSSSKYILHSESKAENDSILSKNYIQTDANSRISLFKENIKLINIKPKNSTEISK